MYLRKYLAEIYLVATKNHFLILPIYKKFQKILNINFKRKIADTWAMLASKTYGLRGYT